jgi:hypothetical protein
MVLLGQKLHVGWIVIASFRQGLYVVHFISIWNCSISLRSEKCVFLSLAALYLLKAGGTISLIRYVGSVADLVDSLSIRSEQEQSHQEGQEVFHKRFVGWLLFEKILGETKFYMGLVKRLMVIPL